MKCSYNQSLNEDYTSERSDCSSSHTLSVLNTLNNNHQNSIPSVGLQRNWYLAYTTRYVESNNKSPMGNSIYTTKNSLMNIFNRFK